MSEELYSIYLYRKLTGSTAVQHQQLLYLVIFRYNFKWWGGLNSRNDMNCELLSRGLGTTMAF